jgi:hypothetical protein
MPTDALAIEAAPYPASGRSAPADLPPGKRGVRGRIAAVVALLALVALSTSWWHGHGGGGLGGAGFSIAYTLDGWRSWGLLMLTLVAGILLVGAGVLWTARRPWGVVLGGAIVVAALALGSWAVVTGQRFGTLSVAEFQAAHLGVSRAQLEQRLGAPLLTNVTPTPSTPAAALDCDIYRTHAGSNYPVAALCFRDGVLALKLSDQGGVVP